MVAFGRKLSACLSLFPLVVRAVQQPTEADVWKAIGGNDSYHSQLYPCPSACSNYASLNWTLYPSLDDIKTCAEPMLLDFSIFNSLKDDPKSVTIRACTLTNSSSLVNALAPESSNETQPVHPEVAADVDVQSLAKCMRNGEPGKKDLAVSLSDGKRIGETKDLLHLIDLTRDNLGQRAACDRTTLFGYYKQVVLGIAVGTSFGKASALSALSALTESLGSDDESSGILVELCGDGRGAANVLGVAASLSDEVPAVQERVRDWVSGSCGSGNSSSTVRNVSADIWEHVGPPARNISNISSLNATNVTISRRSDHHVLEKRDGDCRTVSVTASDTCGTLYQKCGVGPFEFMTYNTADNFCNNLKAGQRVCCSSGLRPANDDGTATIAIVAAGDGCDAITKKCGNQAFEWLANNPKGCLNLQPGQRVRCSKGLWPELPDGTCVPVVVGPKDDCVSLSSKCGAQGLELWAYNPANLCDSLHTGQRVCCSKGRLATNDCRTATVNAGDGGCYGMAQKCGITVTDVTIYNPQDNFCNLLAVGQKVCCSSGLVPRPKKQADGTCATYLVQPSDTCLGLALGNGLTLDELLGFNERTTWGWRGCGAGELNYGLNICLSEGDPPLPAPYPNAVCGPVKPGTTKQPGTNVADLNPCPLNACCNVWGQCGQSVDFCTVFKSPTGAPGFSPPGGNGCISNCGTDIVNKDTPPKDGFQRIGYWESWNLDRPCVTLNVQDAPSIGDYTHIHWAFADIDTNTWKPVIKDPHNQWPDFKAMTGVKRIVSFGGWSFSTAPPTYAILRQAVQPGTRDIFAANVAAFVQAEGLDGVDFDWEYPGAYDIKGTPPGGPDEGYNYLVFLATLKGKLAAGKSLSIAAPSSFWYLRAFFIGYLNLYLDYVVYMTYDLHGQWDYGNKWSVEGCPAGNCVRSHVNLTETKRALTMITKAGMPTNKIFVGEASYARSFHLASAWCGGPMCQFTGDAEHSDAQPGVCTGTAGYISNAELEAIRQGSAPVFAWHDGDSDSDIMVWNDQWAAYMSDDTKESRRNLWKSYNFAGTVDWAVDLNVAVDNTPLWPDDSSEVLDDDGDGPLLTDGNGPYESCHSTFPHQSLSDFGTPNYANGRECDDLDILIAVQYSAASSLRLFKAIMSDDYDAKFSTFANAMVGNAGTAIDDFMRQHANDYFTCRLSVRTYCCDQCKDNTLGCQNCFTDDSCCTSNVAETKMKREDVHPSGPCGREWLRAKWVEVSAPCPSGDDWKRNTRQTVRYTLKPDRADAFYADLFKASLVPKDKIGWRDWERYSDCHDTLENCQHEDWSFNSPYPINWGVADIANPKDVVQGAIDTLGDLPGQLQSAINDLKAGSYVTSPEVLIDATSMNVFMLEDAVNSMEQVSNAAAEIVKEQKEKLFDTIMIFFTAVLILIPAVGEFAAGAARFTSLARTFRVAGIGTNTFLDALSVAEDPQNALFAIVDFLKSSKGLRDTDKLRQAASLRRAFGDVGKLGKAGESVKKIDDIKNQPRACGLKKRDLDFNPGAWPLGIAVNGTEVDW